MTNVWTCLVCGRATGMRDQVCLPCQVKRKRESSLVVRPVAPWRSPAVQWCKRCGEPLTVPKSIERGYGPTCWAAEQVERGGRA